MRSKTCSTTYRVQLRSGTEQARLAVLSSVPQQLPQRFRFSGADGANEPRQNCFTVGGGAQHLEHELGRVVFAGGHRTVAVRPGGTLAFNEALLFQAGKYRQDSGDGQRTGLRGVVPG